MEGLSLDQLRVFAAVAALGSFSATARQLGRAPSAITYAVQALEAQLGLDLFDRSGYRVALNEAGRALMPRVERILKEAAVLRAQAQGIAGGLESDIAVAIDALFPIDAVAAVLRGFNERFPTVAPRFLIEPSASAERMALDGTADFGVLVDFRAHDADLVQIQLDPIELVAVAAPDHPLASQPAPLTADDVRDHVQLVLGDAPTLAADEEWRDRGVLALRTWRLTDLEAKRRMLLTGLGWGSMPRHAVAADIAGGRLCELRLTQWDSADRLPHLSASIVYRRAKALGPATRWLLHEMAPHLA
ncbi:MAG TPA: LysR family transcriptional regulator [Roseiarcus sp.]|jgi:DNA-binding transcriptional LysR family regulator